MKHAELKGIYYPMSSYPEKIARNGSFISNHHHLIKETDRKDMLCRTEIIYILAFGDK